MLVLLKRKLKVYFVRGSGRRQTNPTTLVDCLEHERSHASKSKKHMFVLFCTILTVFYVCYGGITNLYIAENFEQERKRDSIEIYVRVVNKTNQKSEYPTEVHTGSDDFLYKSLLMGNPVTRKKPFTQRDNLPKCFTTFVNNMSYKVEKRVDTTIYLDDLYPMVEMGGHYSPMDCRALHKVAILVPFQHREDQLRVFLYNIHPFLMRQNIEYRIVVIVQSGAELFNKGRLYNAGFHEIAMMGDYQCVVFHDVDLLPTDDRIRYSCPVLPRHMCGSVIDEQLVASTSNKTKFSGVTAMTMWQYREVNGYSNAYWGGGGHNEDMLKRLQASGLGVTEYKKTIARYISLHHKISFKKRLNNVLLQTAVDRYKRDGLSSLHYEKLSYAAHHNLYTRILVDINPKREEFKNFTKRF